MATTFDYEFEDLGLLFLGSKAQYGSFSGVATVKVWGHGFFNVERIILNGQAKGDAGVMLDVYRDHAGGDALIDQCTRNAVLAGLSNALESVLKDHEEVTGYDKFDPVREYGTYDARAL